MDQKFCRDSNLRAKVMYESVKLDVLTASDEEVRFESDIDGSITNLKVVQIRFHHHKPHLI